jgi:hypothetical protein
MCCLVSSILLLGPRGLLFIWWLVEPARFSLTFNSFLFPFLGFLFLPWTTLAYIIAAPGGIDGWEVVGLGLAVALDIVTFVGGGISGRQRYAAPQTS